MDIGISSIFEPFDSMKGRFQFYHRGRYFSAAKATDMNLDMGLCCDNVRRLPSLIGGKSSRSWLVAGRKSRAALPGGLYEMFLGQLVVGSTPSSAVIHCTSDWGSKYVAVYSASTRSLKHHIELQAHKEPLLCFCVPLY